MRRNGENIEEENMLYLGCHLSSSKGYENMAKEAAAIGGNTFQFFTRNPRGGKAKAMDEEDVRRFLKRTEELKLGKIVAHAPYTLNPCSKDPKVREFAHLIMEDDLVRMEYTPGNYYNFRPWKPCWAGHYDRNRDDCRSAESYSKAGADDDGAAGNHGGKRQ